jgi:hypothetical protein
MIMQTFQFFCLTLLIFLMTNTLSAKDHKEYHSCVPSTDLTFPVNPSFNGLKNLNMGSSRHKESDFNFALNQFQKVMGKVTSEIYNKKLTIENLWSEEKIVIKTTRGDFDDNPIIKVSGALLRHPQTTIDDLYLLLCHELGHHLGGAPYKKRGNSGKLSWSSAEGQADYYAVTKCLPRIFQSLKDSSLKTKSLKNDIKRHIQLYCNNSYCERATAASYSTGIFFASLKESPNPSLKDRDMTQVYETKYGHPRPQCRLDTFISGIHCPIDYRVEFDPTDLTVGACIRESQVFDPSEEQELLGPRPLCWYNPEKL